MENYYFGIIDYAVFFVMLIACVAMGLYVGCKDRYCSSVKTPNLKEYLTGGKNMKPFPVAMSLVASYISGVTILGTPAEVYNFGTQYWLIAVSICISGIIVAFVYLPVFYRLQVNSSYEYLEMRFNRAVRIFASTLFVLDEIMFLPIVIYVPSLAFNQVTGVNIYIIGCIVCITCMFYTILGGLKAVVYTDTWQIGVMFVSVVAIVALGCVAIGGPGVVWERNLAGGRIIFDNFSGSMYERHSVYAVLFGGSIYWTAFNGVNQTMVQRYLSLPSERESKLSVLIFTVGTSLFISLCTFCGLLVYAAYYQCDPLSAGRINQDDQLLPLYVIETVGHLQGIPGLFISGVFAAALSSMSVILNSVSQVILEDFVKGCLRIHLNEKSSMVLVKLVVVVLGSMSMGFLFLIEQMGGVLSVATSLSAIAAGNTFGIFSVGILIPWASPAGTIIGAIAGTLLSGMVAFGNQYAIAVKSIIPHKLPVSVDNCLIDYGIRTNSTMIVNNLCNYPDESYVFPLFKISYNWVTPIGVLTTMTVAAIASSLLGKTDLTRLDPELIWPPCQSLLPPEAQRYAGTASKRVKERDLMSNNEDGCLIQVNTSMTAC